MLVGIDLDNTIIDYNPIFKKILIERKIHLRKNDNIKEVLKKNIKNCEWTELQGIIYGKKINYAKVYDNFDNFLKFSYFNNIQVVIISHKTKYPYIGKKINLHEAAKKFLKKKLVNYKYIKKIFFESNIKKKINRIRKLDCDFFIDDLKKILDNNKFPDTTQKILFDTHSQNGFNKWKNIQNFIKHKIEKYKTGNNQALIIENKKKIFIKKFKNKNLFNNEIKFLDYLKKNKIKNFPEVVKINYKRKVLKQKYYSNILQINNQKLFEQNLHFIKNINEKKIAQKKFRNAKGYISNVKLYKNELSNRFKEIKKILLKKNKKKYFDIYNSVLILYKKLIKKDYFDKNFNQKNEKILSPCDFHFKNMIINKKIIYVDFEYSGFDEISKLFAVYFTQPERFFSYSFYQNNKIYIKKKFPNINLEKMNFLLPICFIRWCLILYKKMNTDDIRNTKFQYDKISKYFLTRKIYFNLIL